MVPDIALKELLNDHCLIIDGLARCGKALVAPLVSNLHNVDYAQFSTTIDQIPVYWRLGHLNDNGAASFLRMNVDVAMYERGIGRHLNTRIKDNYSIYNSLESQELLERAKGEEGKEISERFNAEGRYFSFITHSMMPLMDLWFQALPAVRALTIVRHPVDICHSWLLRGWGHRWGKDPMAFIPVADTSSGLVPWFAYDFAEQYQSMSPPDRIVRSVLGLMEMSDRAIAELPEKRQQQIYKVAFENVVSDPYGQLEGVADWLGTTLHENMAEAFARASVPGEISVERRNEKMAELKEIVDKRLFEALSAASLAYEANENI